MWGYLKKSLLTTIPSSQVIDGLNLQISMKLIQEKQHPITLNPILLRERLKWERAYNTRRLRPDRDPKLKSQELILQKEQQEYKSNHGSPQASEYEYDEDNDSQAYEEIPDVEQDEIDENFEEDDYDYHSEVEQYEDYASQTDVEEKNEYECEENPLQLDKDQSGSEDYDYFTPQDESAEESVQYLSSTDEKDENKEDKQQNNNHNSDEDNQSSFDEYDPRGELFLDEFPNWNQNEIINEEQNDEEETSSQNYKIVPIRAQHPTLIKRYIHETQGSHSVPLKYKETYENKNIHASISASRYSTRKGTTHVTMEREIRMCMLSINDILNTQEKTTENNKKLIEKTINHKRPQEEVELRNAPTKKQKIKEFPTKIEYLPQEDDSVTSTIVTYTKDKPETKNRGLISLMDKPTIRNKDDYLTNETNEEKTQVTKNRTSDVKMLVPIPKKPADLKQQNRVRLEQSKKDKILNKIQILAVKKYKKLQINQPQVKTLYENQILKTNTLDNEQNGQNNINSAKESQKQIECIKNQYESHHQTLNCDTSLKQMSLDDKMASTPNPGCYKTQTSSKQYIRRFNQLSHMGSYTIQTSSQQKNNQTKNPNATMDPEPPYGPDWYNQLSEREEEIHQEAKRRKEWKNIIQNKRKRMKTLEIFINRSSPISEDDQVSDNILKEEEEWENKYQQTIQKYYEEDNQKYRLIDKFVTTDENNQPTHEVSVTINIKDIRQDKNKRPRECIINYKIKRQTATRSYGLGEEVKETQQMRTDNKITVTAESAAIIQTTTMQTAYLTNVKSPASILTDAKAEHSVIEEAISSFIIETISLLDDDEENVPPKHKPTTTNSHADAKKRDADGKFIKNKPETTNLQTPSQKIVHKKVLMNNLTGKLQPRVTVALERLGRAATPEPPLIEQQKLDNVDSQKEGGLPSGQLIQMISNRGNIPGSGSSIEEPVRMPARSPQSENTNYD
ncbi:uncharacterized protein DDB_G0283697 [Solenopsis invicta]|uniref:uncharacterized protein DDB_G0283697 n=1 Tax=Solenopsis invicta TaxID=13686 RepID=UPI00193E3058|nr:uncharacterized protein DDB_G0283697 [Solenopsis invicta]